MVHLPCLRWIRGEAGEGISREQRHTSILIENEEHRVADAGEYSLEEDIYTNALLSVLSPADNCCSVSVAVVLLGAIFLAQGIVTLQIYEYVQFSLSFSSADSVKAKQLRFIYNDLLNDGELEFTRLEKADISDICGDFEYGIQEEKLEGTSWEAYFEYTKVPVQSWAPEDIPNERGDLDDARFVLEHLSSYELTFLIVAAIWACTMIAEFRLIGRFVLSCWNIGVVREGAPTVERSEDQFAITGFNHGGKAMAYIIGLFRFGLTVFLFCVGCLFLEWTSSVLDLILNAVALVFVLELDHITYVAIVSAPRQNLISNLRPLKWRDPFYIRTGMNENRVCYMVLTSIACVLVAGTMRYRQLGRYGEKFDLVAAACLFLGPTPHFWVKYGSVFPVPGLCETVLALRCETPVQGETGKPCIQHMNQDLCTSYSAADRPFNTWEKIDFEVQGACVSGLDLQRVEDLDFSGGSPVDALGRACQSMWQRRLNTLVVNYGGVAGDTRLVRNWAQRTRIFPFRDYVPAAPFWCPYVGGADTVLREDQPMSILAGLDLSSCSNQPLNYTKLSD